MIVNCGNPTSPTNGTLGPYSHTRSGATVDVRCNNGFRPSAVMTSFCELNAQWFPLPDQLNCVLMTGNTYKIIKVTEVVLE